MKNIKIVNTGGTFNKVYDEINGELVVPSNNDSIEDIIKNSFKHAVNNISIDGLIYKDSLEMNDSDRTLLAEYISALSEEYVIIIHGTDTIDVTADYLYNYGLEKSVVLVGAMMPYSVNPIESSLNLGMAIGFLEGNEESGVYISMNGIVGSYKNVKKNKIAGYFEFNELN